MKKILVIGDSRSGRVVKAIAGIKPVMGKGVEIIEADLAGSPDLHKIKADLVCVFGGDGSLLRAVYHLGANQLPIVGINVGHLGFLTEFSETELVAALPKILSGEITPGQRMMLDVRLTRAGKELQAWHALNEAVLVRLYRVQMIRFRVTIDSTEITQISGDGVITATPTGSTAYSLSAGGSIVVPGAEAICITPVNPHTVTSRPLVVKADSVVEIELLADREKVVVSVDGREGYGVERGDVVTVRRSERRCRLVENKAFFETLRTKLSWGGSPTYGKN